jgi:NADH-quinone oxidoreductase subunit N
MISYAAAWPIVVAACAAFVVLLAEMLVPRRTNAGIGWLTVVSLLTIAYVSTTAHTETPFLRAIVFDSLAVFGAVLLCVMGALTVLMAMDYLPRIRADVGEYYPLVLFALTGLIVMGSATDLVVMFLGLETMSMAVYVLTGSWRKSSRSSEAALKYFIMGAFASGFMLYGIALIYGVTGGTTMAAIKSAGQIADGAMLRVGTVMLFVGFAFKIAAVPFHLWTPDAYEGAPTSVTAFMATVVKAGTFVAILRTVANGALPFADLWPLLWVSSVATMTVGNVVALRQSSLKRMLAYSSIAHTGYLLVGVIAGTADGAAAVLVYLVAYGAMNLGAFGLLMLITPAGEPDDEIRRLAGLSQSHPAVAAAMAVCMLSLTGIPPLAGFLGKFYLFSAALEQGYVVLVAIAVLNSVVSAAYYIGVIRTMYIEPGTGLVPPGRSRLVVATAVAVIATVGLGIAPAGLIGAAGAAVDRILIGG